jgi:hypothetical protein
MCFSATASFTSAGLLLVIGGFSFLTAKKISKRFLLLNLMGFFFAIQQFSEGMIWIGNKTPGPLFWAHVFLFFAFFVYSWFLAVACRPIARTVKRKKAITVLAGFGFIYGAWLFINVLLTPNISANLCSLHIYYHILLQGKYPFAPWLLHGVLTPIYIIFVALPFFLCGRRQMTIAGSVITLLAIVCITVYDHYFVSVWCFYAAIMTLVITAVTYVQLRAKRRRITKAP